jgi:DNA mismatch repair ATPase MutL
MAASPSSTGTTNHHPLHLLHRAPPRRRWHGPHDHSRLHLLAPMPRPPPVAQSYAIDNEGVAISCRKGGETTADLSAAAGQSTVDTIRGIYGSAVAKELLKLDAAEPAVGLQLRGLARGLKKQNSAVIPASSARGAQKPKA